MSLRRRFARLAILLLVTYLGIVIVFWFLERRLVFLPTPATEEWLVPVDPRTEEVTFRASDGNEIGALWIPPETPQHGAVLVSHGNGGNASHRGRLAAELRKVLGAGVLVYDYPGYGKSGGKPTEASCYAAGEAAHQWLRDTAKLGAGRIILCGESLGGGPAVELATRHEHRALLLIYTFTNLPAAAKSHFRLLPTHTFMRTRFDNLSKIGRIRRPVFLIHGTADAVIPYAHSASLFEAANEPKELLTLDGFGHSTLVGQRFSEPFAEFLAKHAP